MHRLHPLTAHFTAMSLLSTLATVPSPSHAVISAFSTPQIISNPANGPGADGSADDSFGQKIALSGNTLVVQALGDDGPWGTGSVYVFVRDAANQWGLHTKLTGTGGSTSVSNRGVAIDNNLLAYGVLEGSVEKVYVYRRQGTQWTLDGTLIPSDQSTSSNEGFGKSIAISGDTIVVGSPYHTLQGALNRGSTYIFEKVAGQYTQTQITHAGDSPQAGDNFGSAVAIEGQRVAVGAPGADVSNNGAVYVFEKSGATWSRTHKLLSAPTGLDADGQFGAAVKLIGNRMAVGEPAYDAPGPNSTGQGTVVIFDFDSASSAWVETTKLLDTDLVKSDQLGGGFAFGPDIVFAQRSYFGQGAREIIEFRNTGGVWAQTVITSSELVMPDLGYSANLLVAGVPSAKIGLYSSQGGVVVFDKIAGQPWQQASTLINSGNGATAERFGSAIAVKDGVAVIGVPYDDVDGDLQGGAAYVVRFDGTKWNVEKRLVPSDGGPADWFGAAVAISGSNILIGAPGATVVANASQGAVYRYTDVGGGNWQQQGLRWTASDGAAGDAFGTAVAIDGTRALIGAPRAEGGGGTIDEGYVYAFAEVGGVWGQVQQIPQPNAATDDLFGASVAINGNLAAVGMPGFDNGAAKNVGKGLVFRAAGNSWSEEASFTTSGSSLGTRAAAYGSRVAFLEYQKLRIYAQSGGAWSQETVVDVPKGVDTSVGLSDSILVCGGVYYRRTGATWSLVQTLKNPLYDLYGLAVALDGDDVLIGDTYSSGLPTVYGNVAMGAVYFYRNGAQPTSIQFDSVTPSPSLVNESYAVKVTVTSSGATPTGVVTITDDKGSSCTIPALSSGSGTCNLQSSVLGQRTLLAEYAETADFKFSSATRTQLVAATDLGDGPVTTPRHVIVAPFLGVNSPDGEVTLTASAAATADDTTGNDDEDGLLAPLPTFAVGQDATLVVKASGGGLLAVQIDWNRDSDYKDADELFGPYNVIAGDTPITFKVPASVVAGQPVSLRLRLSAGADVLSTISRSGEVEDYAIPVIVGSPPTLVPPGKVTLREDQSTGALSFQVSDAETVVANLIVSATSSNESLLPAAPLNASLGGSGGIRSIVVAPTPNASGSATITLTVADADGLTGTAQFIVDVTPVNDAPSFTASTTSIVDATAGLHELPGFVTSTHLGPLENLQSIVEYEVAANDPVLDVVSVGTDGTLSYVLSGAIGKANVSVRLRDSGGIADGGIDLSAPVNLAISYLPPNEVIFLDDFEQ